MTNNTSGERSGWSGNRKWLAKRIRKGLQCIKRKLLGSGASAEGSRAFPGSTAYWEQRYQSGGNSGGGSYGDLADYKARVLNEFIRQERIESVVEFGAGDGNQLSLLVAPRYIGLDVSATAVYCLKERFAEDTTKEFHLLDENNPPRAAIRAELSLSLDVIYHLIEDQTFERYMHDLFQAATRYVIVYSSSSEDPAPAPHVRHRRFTDYAKATFTDWQLFKKLDNPHRSATFADFFFYRRIDVGA